MEQVILALEHSKFWPLITAINSIKDTNQLFVRLPESPTIQLNSDTIYLDRASDSTG